jgi:hypothetical protein
MVRDARRAGAIIIWAAFLLGAGYIASAPWQSPALAAWYVPSARLSDPAQLEKRAEMAVELWPRQPDEPDDEPLNADNAEPIDAHDGVYVGMVTTKAESRLVTVNLTVAKGIGLGTQSQRECGVAPISLRVSSTGKVTGLALMFSSTCLKTEVAIRGRAIGGTLQLRLGNQFLELSKSSD